MTALRRLADPRLRPAWHAALAAAALAVVLMTGAAAWFLHPWRFAGLLAAAAALSGWWLLDRIDPHTGKRQRGQPAPDEREALAAAERASQDRLMGRQPVSAGQRAGYWPMGDSERDNGQDKTRSDIAYPQAGTAAWADITADRLHPFIQVPDAHVLICRCGKWPGHHVHTGDRAACTCDECAGIIGGLQALVFDDPVPGREYDAELDVRHHAWQPGARPYCSRPCCGSRSHWPEDHRDDPLAAERERAVRLPDYAAAALGHYTVDAAVESIFTKAMGRAAAAIEGARKP